LHRWPVRWGCQHKSVVRQGPRQLGRGGTAAGQGSSRKRGTAEAQGQRSGTHLQHHLQRTHVVVGHHAEPGHHGPEPHVALGVGGGRHCGDGPAPEIVLGNNHGGLAGGRRDGAWGIGRKSGGERGRAGESGGERWRSEENGGERGRAGRMRESTCAARGSRGGLSEGKHGVSKGTWLTCAPGEAGGAREERVGERKSAHVCARLAREGHEQCVSGGGARHGGCVARSEDAANAPSHAHLVGWDALDVVAPATGQLHRAFTSLHSGVHGKHLTGDRGHVGSRGAHGSNHRRVSKVGVWVGGWVGIRSVVHMCSAQGVQRDEYSFAPDRSQTAW
jgi:hypothetical protein